jgi:DNA-binding winged helix-turn-helix (wHTH) protein/tetratricopeptide (TPR) repeat protein
MRPDTRSYRFGPFHLDPGRRKLSRGADHVWLPDRSLDLLIVLAANAGRVLSKDTLTEAVWRDVAVTDNSLCQAISALRHALGRQDDGAPYIETRIRKGYAFVAPVEIASAADKHAPEPHTTNLQTCLDPFGAFIDGRAALETLSRDAVVRARTAFAAVLTVEPGFAPAHIGMTTACVLAFESTRADLQPDRASLREAAHHARDACRLDSASGHAWSALALVHHAGGESREAVAAARKAIALQPHEWRHYLRLAHVSWGGERLEAAYRVLSLCPRLALAHWFAASVFIARGADDSAREHLREGCLLQDSARSPFAAVGLHLLHGLLLASRPASAPGTADFAVDDARAELMRELAFESCGHIYARETCANAWYALGALSLREHRVHEARDAFREALARVPGHPMATVGLHASSGTAAHSLARIECRDPEAASPADAGEAANPAAAADAHAIDAIDRAIVTAAIHSLDGRHRDAAAVCEAALAAAPPGSAGWRLPIEPLLRAGAHRDAWIAALDRVRDRAV